MNPLMRVILALKIHFLFNRKHDDSAACGPVADCNGMHACGGEILIIKNNSIIDVYIPLSKPDIYLRYRLNRRIDERRRTDVWRINTVSESERISDFTFRNLIYICGTGEFECAVLEHGKSDYMGGWRHGNERTLKMQIFIDDNELNERNIGNYKCRKIVVKQKSELLEVDNPEIKVKAVCEREWIFKDGRLVINNSLVFLDEINLERTYLGMFPISRISNNELVYISDSAFRGSEKVHEDISKSGFKIKYDESESIKYTSANGYVSIFSVLRGFDKPNRMTWIQSSPEYNKGYFDFTGKNYYALRGEIINASVSYEIYKENLP